MSSKKRVSVEHIIEIILILIVLFVVGCSINENQLTKGTSASSNNILDDCKCTQYCYGEIYDTACLIDKASHPQNCIDWVGTKTAKGVYGGEDQYFTEETKKACFERLISKQTSIEICTSFPDEFQYKCFSNVGKKNLEPQPCKELPYSYKSDCYLHISKNKADFILALCNELSHDDRVTCYSNKATINNDSSVCLNLETKPDKNNCYSQIYKDFDYSEKYENYMRTHNEPIYYNWFKKVKIDKDVLDESYCKFEGVNGGVLSERWQISQSYEKNNSCYISIAIYHKNLDECYRLSRDYLGQDLVRSCIFYTALLNNFEIEDCDKLGVDFKECRDGVVLSKRNPELCKEIYNTEKEKSNCIYTIAKDVKNILYCKDVGSYKGDCISAIYKEDDEQFLQKEVCELLSTSNDFLTLSAKCYYNFALKNLDLSSCEKIDDGYSSMKSDCKERLQNAIKTQR